MRSWPSVFLSRLTASASAGTANHKRHPRLPHKLSPNHAACGWGLCLCSRPILGTGPIQRSLPKPALGRLTSRRRSARARAIDKPSSENGMLPAFRVLLPVVIRAQRKPARGQRARELAWRVASLNPGMASHRGEFLPVERKRLYSTLPAPRRRSASICSLRAAAEAGAIDLQVLHDPLHVVARLRERNALDPVDRVDLGIARIAVALDPFLARCRGRHCSRRRS